MRERCASLVRCCSLNCRIYDQWSIGIIRTRGTVQMGPSIVYGTSDLKGVYCAECALILLFVWNQWIQIKRVINKWYHYYNIIGLKCTSEELHLADSRSWMIYECIIYVCYIYYAYILFIFIFKQKKNAKSTITKIE